MISGLLFLVSVGVTWSDISKGDASEDPKLCIMSYPCRITTYYYSSHRVCLADVHTLHPLSFVELYHPNIKYTNRTLTLVTSTITIDMITS